MHYWAAETGEERQRTAFSGQRFHTEGAKSRVGGKGCGGKRGGGCGVVGISGYGVWVWVYGLWCYGLGCYERESERVWEGVRGWEVEGDLIDGYVAVVVMTLCSRLLCGLRK